ncbi:MAG: hypothetical protein ACRDOK_02400 [Streptosporangiaceae bacterium]
MAEVLLGGLAGDAQPVSDLGPGVPAGRGPGDGGGGKPLGFANSGVRGGDPVEDVDRRAGRQAVRGGAFAEG